ncbi:hypothetical protein LAWI1_G005641, partial [Lachnellula willkommii]
SYYESQSPLEQRQPDPHTSQPLGATSYTRVPTSGPIEASAAVPSRAPVQEYISPPQKQNHQTRKRGPDTSIETGAERPLKRARLTQRNLKAFENMGGQRRKSAGKKSTGRSSSTTTTTDEDLGPQLHQPKSRTSNSETKSTRSKQSISTTDPGFQDAAFDNGILNPENSKPHTNLKKSKVQINRTRDTVSPSESEYEKFAHKIRTAPNEQTVLLQTSSLLKEYGTDDSRYSKVYNQAFIAFPKNVSFNTGLSAAQPDMVEGLEMPEFDPFPVRQQLGGAAVPTSGTNAITLPHLAGEWKGPGKDMILAQTQAAYDGACMVYGRNEALSFLNSPDQAGHAFVSTFTTDGTTLNTFAHYSSESQGQVKYHQYPTSGSFLISSHEDFKTSRRRLRNLQDDAKEASEKLRDELNEKWSANHRSPVSPNVPVDASDFTDSNSYDYDDEEDPTNQLLAEYWTSFPTNDQYDSSVQVPAADNVNAPPSASFQENNQDGSFVRSVHAPPYASSPANDEDDPFLQVSTANNGYTSPNGLTFPLITPPQSSEDSSLPLESSEDIDQSNGRGHRRTRRTRKQVVIVDARKTRRKHEG